MSARCDLSDLPVEMCACRIHGPKAEPTPRPEVVGQPFIAAYPGECWSCEGRIEPGDRIIATAGIESGQRSYIHASHP